MNLTLSEEATVLAKLMGENKGDGWQVSTSLDDVPADVGHYALYDGLNVKACGTTRNMLEALKSSQSGQLKRPIYHWKPDTDGSAALWLEGKMRCPHCKDEETILDVFFTDEHFRDAHGIESDDE